MNDGLIPDSDPIGLTTSHGQMEWRFEHLIGGRVLRVTTRGIMDLDGRIEMMKALLAEATKIGARLFLVDHREVTVRLTTLDIYNLPQINARLGLRGDERAAIVYAPHQKADASFYEARARNSGFTHRAFNNEHEAMRWLLAVPGGRGVTWRPAGTRN